MINAANVQSLLSRVTQRIVGLSRGVRIVLVVVFAGALTLLVTPLAYSILRVDFFAATSDEIFAPTLIAMVSGVVLYIVGWRLLVGFAGERPAPSSALLIYFVAGVAVCVLALTLVVIGAVTGTGT